MQSTVGKIVTTFEQIDSSQLSAGSSSVAGRLGAAGVWFIFNLTGLLAGMFAPQLGFCSGESVSIAGCVAFAQSLFAMAALPAIMFNRYSLYSVDSKVFKWQEFVLWAAIGLVFTASAALSEPVEIYNTLIAAVAGLSSFLPAGIIARACRNSARASRGGLSDFNERFLPVGPLAFAILISLSVPSAIVIVSRFGHAAFNAATGLYPPLLAYILCKNGLIVPTIWQMASIGFWLIAVMAIAVAINKIKSKR